MLFHLRPLPCAFPLSPLVRSKVIFDGMDNSFQSDRWDTVRDAHHSSTHQTVKDDSWSITWRGGENWPLDNLEGKQWYENSTSFKIYVLYHLICFKLLLEFRTIFKNGTNLNLNENLKIFFLSFLLVAHIFHIFLLKI